MIVPGRLVCSSFLISVYMFIVSIALPHMECCIDCSHRGSQLVDPFAKVLFKGLTKWLPLRKQSLYHSI